MAVFKIPFLDSGNKIPTEKLGGIGADNTKFLRGDQTWTIPLGGVQIMGGSNISVSSIDDNTRFIGIHSWGEQTYENQAEYYVPIAGTISKFYFYVWENTVTAITTLTFRKNGVDTNLVLSYNSLEIGMKNNLVDSFTVVAGDRICIKLVVPAVAGSKYFRASSYSFSFTPI